MIVSVIDLAEVKTSVQLNVVVFIQLEMPAAAVGTIWSAAYLLVEQFARLLLDGVDELHLPSREAHQQGDALCRGREVVEVMACGLRSFVNALVYRFAQVGRLRRDRSTRNE